jgi:hypothetical protein
MKSSPSPTFPESRSCILSRQSPLTHHIYHLSISQLLAHSQLPLTLPLESLNQARCTGIMGPGTGTLFQLALDLLCKTLAKLDTPLIERVDIPDRALGEGCMLIEDNQCTKSSRCDFLGKDTGRWSVTQESLVLKERFRSVLGFELLLVFADHQGFGLSEEVGSEHLLVLVVGDRVVGFGGEDEVCGDELGALVQQLVEGVLGVGGGLAEEDGAGGVLDEGVAGAGNGLSVGFHGELLQVGGEAVEVLVESAKLKICFIEGSQDLRGNKVGLSTVEIRVPNAQQACNDRNVLLKGCGTEMHIHSMCTL